MMRIDETQNRHRVRCVGLYNCSLVLAAYFFFRKPEKISPPVLTEGKTALVFKDVRYSGERKGVIDWEIKAKVARKYIDKPVVEMEEIEGRYKPKTEAVIWFKGSKGSMDTEQEQGRMENVQVFYNQEYTLTTQFMEFDFKKGITSTSAPVEIKGSQFTLTGIGMVANTKEETVRIEKNVRGSVPTKKGVLNFQSDTFTYRVKDNLYVLDGNVAMKGEDMDLVSRIAYVYTDGKDLTKIDAQGQVRLVSKGRVAKSEQAVYHFK